MTNIKKRLKCPQCTYGTEVSISFDAVVYCPYHGEAMQEVSSA